MDKSAIEQIQQSSSIPEMIISLENHETENPVILTPDNFQIINLERYMEFRTNYRYSFETTSIKDFIKYCSDYDQAGACCFVNQEYMSARTIFDLGTVEEPLHQDNKAKLLIKRTAAYVALLAVNGSKMSQKDASDFIEDWADELVIYSTSGDSMSPTQAAASLRDLTIETARAVNSKVADYSESMSAMEKVEAKNKEYLPGEIKFGCIPYLHLKERFFTIRLSLLTSGDRPALTFRIIKLDSITEEIAEEFKDILVDGFKEAEAEVYMGS